MSSQNCPKDLRDPIGIARQGAVIAKRLGARLAFVLLGLVAGAGAVSAQGTWAGPWDWPVCINPCGCTGGSGAHLTEISHAALIPKGPYAGKVVFWRRSVIQASGQPAGTCDSLGVADSWLWDPLAPQEITRITNTVTTPFVGDLFCTGISWHPRGDLFAMGGFRPAVLQNPLREVFRFLPGILPAPVPNGSTPACPIAGGWPMDCDQASSSGGIEAWNYVQTMEVRRFYPTVVALTKRTIQIDYKEYDAPGSPIVVAEGTESHTGGAHLVLGGAPDSGQYIGNTLIEVLPYSKSVWMPPLQSQPIVNLLQREGRYLPVELAPAGSQPFQGSLDSYPRAFQMSNGDILICHDVGTVSTNPPGNYPGDYWVLQLYGTSTPRQKLYRLSVPGGYDRNYGTGVMLHQLGARDRVLVFGGHNNSCTDGVPCPSTNQVLEFVPGSPASPNGPIVAGAWLQKIGLNFNRSDANAVVLPIGQVLITGGYSSRTKTGLVIVDSPVLQPELYIPEGRPTQTTVNGFSLTQSASPIASPQSPYSTARLYHHVAVLLMDGSVLIIGGEAPHPAAQPSSSNGEYSAELYRPDYMARPRATIELVPSVIDMNVEAPPTTKVFEVEIANLKEGFEVERVVLTRPAATTHFFDSDERYIELSFTSGPVVGGAQTLTVAAMEDNLGPPGYYMLWVVTEDQATGELVPTHAKLVTFR